MLLEWIRVQQMLHLLNRDAKFNQDGSAESASAVGAAADGTAAVACLSRFKSAPVPFDNDDEHV